MIEKIGGVEVGHLLRNLAVDGAVIHIPETKKTNKLMNGINSRKNFGDERKTGLDFPEDFFCINFVF